MQLVAYGAQDVYLTGNPQITFFKVVYRRHTNFACETIEQTFNGTGDFGRKVTCSISRNGDLVTKMYVRVKVSSVQNLGTGKFAWVRKLGYALIKNVQIDIGGSQIDKQYGDWMNVWNELARNSSLDNGLSRMLGDVPSMTELSSADANGQWKNGYTMFVPLQFWFCRNNGLALPLIALQYHDVRVNIEFSNLSECVVVCGDAINRYQNANIRFDECSLLVDYVYLDSEERKRFAQASHEYLIEQLQFTGEESVSNTTGKYRLNYNHPCKFLTWAVKLGKFNNIAGNARYLAYSGSDWEEARDTAAKLLYLNSLEHEADGTLKKDGDGQPIQRGDLDAQLMTLLAKVTCAVVVVDVDKSSTDHVVVGNNNLTHRDISLTTSEIFGSMVRTSHLADCDVAVNMPFNYGLYLNGNGNPVSTGKLQLNGHDRFSTREGAYFNYVQTYQHFSNTPVDGINVYSFALNPEAHQPSGTCNFSRIDNTTLVLSYAEEGAPAGSNFKTDFIDDNTKLNVYTVNYNVLRIMSGMGGMAYSN